MNFLDAFLSLYLIIVEKKQLKLYNKSSVYFGGERVWNLKK
jgi:hypothetical protein